jgi:hypothetical protein
VESERMKQDFMTEIDQLDDVQEYELDQKQMWSDLKKYFDFPIKVFLVNENCLFIQYPPDKSWTIAAKTPNNLG